MTKKIGDTHAFCLVTQFLNCPARDNSMLPPAELAVKKARNGGCNRKGRREDMHLDYVVIWRLFISGGDEILHHVM